MCRGIRNFVNCYIGTPVVYARLTLGDFENLHNIESRKVPLLTHVNPLHEDDMFYNRVWPRVSLFFFNDLSSVVVKKK